MGPKGKSQFKAALAQLRSPKPEFRISWWVEALELQWALKPRHHLAYVWNSVGGGGIKEFGEREEMENNDKISPVGKLMDPALLPNFANCEEKQEKKKDLSVSRCFTCNTFSV